MTRDRRRETGRPGRGRGLRLALAALVAALAVLITPGVASAAGTVEGVVDCYQRNSDRSVTIVVGYRSTYAETVTIPLGDRNRQLPAALQGLQPTRFEPGTVQGAFSVRLTEAELNEARWVVDGNRLSYQSGVGYSFRCTPTEMPAEGNGTGPVVALAAGGIFGALLLRHVRRRAAVPAPEAPGA